MPPTALRIARTRRITIKESLIPQKSIIMNRPVKICKNPECKKEYTDYKSAKSKHCCTKCTQRGGYLRREDENMDERERNKQRKRLYELLVSIAISAKKPLKSDLLDQFKIDYSLMIEGTDNNGHTYYRIKNRGIYRNPENPEEIFIKIIVKRKQK